MYGGVFLLQGGEFERPWKRCSIIAKWPLEVEIAMGTVPMPISVSRTHFALRYFCAPIRRGKVRELGGAHHYRLR